MHCAPVTAEDSGIDVSIQNTGGVSGQNIGPFYEYVVAATSELIDKVAIALKYCASQDAGAPKELLQSLKTQERRLLPTTSWSSLRQHSIIEQLPTRLADLSS